MFVNEVFVVWYNYVKLFNIQSNHFAAVHGDEHSFDTQIEITSATNDALTFCVAQPRHLPVLPGARLHDAISQAL